MKNILDLKLIIGGEADVEITEENSDVILPKKPVLDMVNPFPISSDIEENITI